jgi:hypothetical protein
VVKAAANLLSIAGKDGVPALKREGDKGWRIELKRDGFAFQQHVENPVMQLDEENERFAVEVPVDGHVPIAVFKCFVKMALSLMPEEEIGNFGWALGWLQEVKHTRPFHPEMARLWFMFAPGPRPFEGVTAFLFLRKEGVNDVPHCTFVLAIGNESYQMFLPCPEKDSHFQGTQITTPLLPTPYHAKPSKYGLPTHPDSYDLSRTDVVRDKKIKRYFHMNVAPKTKT